MRFEPLQLLGDQSADPPAIPAAVEGEHHHAVAEGQYEHGLRAVDGVTGGDLLGAYRNVPVPLMTWENDLLDDLAMTGKRLGTDFGMAEKEHYLWMVNAPHPLSGGVPAGVAVGYAKDAPMGWGKPGLGASIIASVAGDPSKATIFGYEKGATMDYETLAPARRVFFFLDNETFPNLTPTGRKLFDAAIDWAAAGGK